MIPILYEANETAFTSNGIARLRDCISCTVTEERNGVYECDFDYPVDGAHFGEIIPGRIIAVIHDDSGDVQPFDIVSYTKPIDGIVSFHAVHISYRQSFLAVTGSEINSLADAFNLLTTASPDNPFTYWTDFTSAAYFSGADGTPKTVRQLLGGSEGSILDTYGGEYEWDKFTVKLWKNRGKTCDFTIRYGINMTDYNEELDEFGSFNSCIPYWNGEGGPVIGSKVSSGLESYNGRELCVPLDLTDKFEAAPSVAGLEAAALAYMTTKQTSLPSQNIKVDFLRLQDFSGYEDFSDLLECSLCDTISVLFPQYGMSGSYKIVRTVFDVLENRFTEMELGALRTSLAEAMGISGGSYSSSGTAGANGKSAYQYAVEAGYTGTEEEFAELLAQIPDDDGLVHKTGSETISGEKTFSATIHGTSTLTQAIPYGKVDSTSTKTVFTATVPGITQLVSGTAVLLENGVVTSASGWTLNVNGLGAKPVYTNMAEETRETTIFNIVYTMLFVYDENRGDNGGWICYRGYDSNTNTIGYQLRTNSMSLPMSDIVYRYRLLFTSADGTKFVPANASSSTKTAAVKAVNQRPIDPFGDIVYYGTTAAVSAGSNPSAAYLWRQNVIALGYSFNSTSAELTLTPWLPVYVKCTPQTNGSAVIDAENPFVQALPNTEDGKIYIYLGVAYSAANIELLAEHPVYYYKSGSIRLWSNCTADEIVAMTGEEIASICQ